MMKPVAITPSGIEFAYEPTLIFQCHPHWHFGREPILRRMPDDSLICLIYSGGATEPSNENVVLVTRSYDDGETWTAAEVLFRHDHRGVWATELFCGGREACIFVNTIAAESCYNELKTFRSFSADNGRTWTKPSSLPGGLNSCSVRQGVELGDGAWIWPVYWQEQLDGWDWVKVEGQFPSSWRFCCGVLKSADQGRNFTLHGNLRAGINLWEPNIVEVSQGQLLMLMRAETTGKLYQSESSDGGVSWSAPCPTMIPNPGSKISLLRVGNAVLLLHNPNPVSGWDSRTPLSLWVSHDGCKTWATKIDLARSCKPGHTVCCYPHAFVDAGCELLYIACENAREHFLIKVPFADFL